MTATKNIYRPIGSLDNLDADGKQRCRSFLNQGVELVQVDRFHQVMLETCLTASADVLLHAKTGESNSKRRFRGEFLDQIDSAPVGQTEVADEHVKFLFTAKLKGGLESKCRLHLITPPPKQIC